MATNQEKQHVANYKIRLLDYDPEIGHCFLDKCYWYEGTLEAAERYATRLAQEKIVIGFAVFEGVKEVSSFWC